MTPEESLDRMKQASEQFYDGAIRTGCHAFIEFAGLMNEYIQVCREYQKANPDKDFRKCNAHSGNPLHFRYPEIQYLNKKLECIYQGLVVVAEEQK